MTAATGDWDPALYLKFTDHRLRPALDLMARVPLAEAAVIYDLGCGPGNVTRLLAERWPRARVTGVDASPEMLAKARAIAGISWQQADLARWRAETRADLPLDRGLLDRYLAMYANQDTLDLPEDARRGIRELYRRGRAAGLLEDVNVEFAP